MKCPKCQYDNPSYSRFCKECGTQLLPAEEISVSQTKTLETPIEELTTGSTFAGRYQIIEELGKGGMGKVYRVLDKKLNEEVAIKLVKPEIASDKKTLERFSNELKIARKIVHKNVGRMYHLSEEKGTHYITMEYVPGEDLKGMIRMMGQLGAGKSISIAKQVCEGLVEAHRLGVIHRDLKPGNIMIDKEGNARIMDFGIARSLKTKGITDAGMMVGTPEYMSPEQAEAGDVDQRSDIYSLGVILYEMVTGRLPFEGDTPLSITMKHKGEIPKDPRELNPHLTEALSRFILNCLEKEKESRYQSVDEILSEIEKIEEGMPTTQRVVPKRKPLTSKEITVSFSLKKLFIPALVFIALVIIVVIIWQIIPQEKTAPLALDKPTIAVLPFSDLSPQKDQEYFCDGMTDEIIAKLSTLKDWKVISRTSVMRYKNTDQDIKKIGKELDVAIILEGSVRKEKDDIRVTAQLINIEDGFHLWSDIYDRKLERIFDIQSDIAENITKALKKKFSPEEQEKLQKRPTENLEAYNLYLQGRWFWNKRSLQGYQKAIEFFEEAIGEDPNYALAYAGIADTYILLKTRLGYSKAKEAALKALEIDNTIAEAHASLATIKYFYDWDWKGAEEEFKRAIDLNPAYATAHHWYAGYLVSITRFDEAIEEIKRALELDPFSLAINLAVGQMYYFARKYDQAIEVLRKTLEMDPNFLRSHSYLGLIYLEKSMYAEALEEFQKEKEVMKGFQMGYFQIYLDPYIGITNARMGRRGEAQQILERLKPLRRLYYFKAILYLSLGENDKGFDLLEKACEVRDIFIASLKVDPLVDGVRSDPRYKALLKKIGLEE